MILNVVGSAEFVGVNRVHGHIVVVDRVVVVRCHSSLQVVTFVNLIFVQRKRILNSNVLNVARFNCLALCRLLKIVGIPNEPLEQWDLLKLSHINVEDMLNLVVRLLLVFFTLSILITTRSSMFIVAIR